MARSVPLGEWTRGLAKRTLGCETGVGVRGDEMTWEHLCVGKQTAAWRSNLPAKLPTVSWLLSSCSPPVTCQPKCAETG